MECTLETAARPLLVAKLASPMPAGIVERLEFTGTGAHDDEGHPDHIVGYPVSHIGDIFLPASNLPMLFPDFFDLLIENLPGIIAIVSDQPGRRLVVSLFLHDGRQRHIISLQDVGIGRHILDPRARIGFAIIDVIILINHDGSHHCNPIPNRIGPLAALWNEKPPRQRSPCALAISPACTAGGRVQSMTSGLRRRSGSNASRMRCIAAISPSLRYLRRNCRFNVPMPCSAVIAPW